MRRATFVGLVLLGLLFLQGCSWSDLPFYWKSFEHPTYRFSLEVPRTWDVELSGRLGAAVVLRASEKDPLFRANSNVVVQRRSSQKPLEEQAKVTFKVLRSVLNEYRLLSESATRLGTLQAHELRGKYRATEGYRIIRTIIGITNEREYIFTFTCREEKEAIFQAVIQKMIASFHAPGSLSPAS